LLLAFCFNSVRDKEPAILPRNSEKDVRLFDLILKIQMNCGLRKTRPIQQSCYNVRWLFQTDWKVGVFAQNHD